MILKKIMEGQRAVEILDDVSRGGEVIPIWKSDAAILDHHEQIEWRQKNSDNDGGDDQGAQEIDPRSDQNTVYRSPGRRRRSINNGIRLIKHGGLLRKNLFPVRGETDHLLLQVTNAKADLAAVLSSISIDQGWAKRIGPRGIERKSYRILDGDGAIH
jgi:hypothetical protein